MKVAKLPPCEHQCEACGQKFKSHKTTCKHKCPKSKVVRVVEKPEEPSQVSHPVALSTLDKPMASPPPHAPTAPPHSTMPPAVTESLRVFPPVPLLFSLPATPKLPLNLEQANNWQEVAELETAGGVMVKASAEMLRLFLELQH